MAERVRRRTSKWDVAAEHYAGTENIRHESALPAEVGESCRLTELNHTNHDCRQPLGYYETKPCLSMNVDSSEIDQSACQSGQVKANNIILSDDLCKKSQYSKQLDLEGDNKDGLKIQDQKHISLDRTMTEYAENKDKPLQVANVMSPGPDDRKRHLSCDANQSGLVKDNNIILLDDFCEMSQYSKQFDLEGDNKDGLKIQDQEHLSQDRTMTEYAENKDKPLKVAIAMSPGSDERRRHLSRDANQSGQIKANNIILSDDFCEKSQYSKQFDLEGDNKDGLKIQDQEHVSQDRTMTEYAENKDKPLKVVNAMSPGPDERRRHLSRDASPTDGRGKSGSKRSRSRSPSYDSRSWSRSPSYASKQGFERWTDKGRMKGAVAPCRDFTAGRCRRGIECRYLHEGGGWRQTNRYHDAGPTNERESRFERGRHIAYGSKENINSRENSRETLSRRHGDPYDDGWDNNKQHKGYRSNEICFDFTKGRCHRGMACKYIHQDASSDDRWRDESRGRFVDRRDGGASFGHRLEHQRVSDVPCKYFLDGHCRHGEGCRYSHQARPLNNPEDRSHDIQHRFASVGNSTLAKVSEQHDQTMQFGITSHLLAGGENELRVSDAQPIDYNDFTNRSLFNKPAILNQDSHKETQPSEQQPTEKKATEEFSATVNTEGDHEGERQADLDLAHNPLSTTSIANQNVDHKGQNQIAPQLMSAQNFASNSPVAQFAPLLPLNGQMQAMHCFPQSGKSQLATLHKPSDAHYFNASMQNQSGHLPRYELSQQRLDYKGQVQQNPLLQSHGKSNYNLTGQIQQNLSLLHNAPSQPNFTIGSQIQHGLSSHIGNSHQNIVAGDVQQTLPQNVQMQEPSVPLLISNGQRQFLAPQPPSNPHSFKSDERNCQLTSKNNSNSLQQLIRSGEGQPQGGADSSEVKSSLFTPDNPITNKVVTTEQAAKIIDLSASLAQFFGTAALNSQSTAGMTPQALINPCSLGSYVDAVTPIPTEVGCSQTNLNLTAPSTVTTLEEKQHEQIHVMEQIKQDEDASAKEVEKIETIQNKEQPLQLQSGGDAEDMKDGDSKKIKEAKATRMFKCALVEFVKDILKPTWKEGQLSKEAHKTIVKKVVDKVSGSLQGPNVPQTQDKIDLYLSNAKPKLSKLVQAYVEKYIKS